MKKTTSLDESLDEPYLSIARKLVSVEEIPAYEELEKLFVHMNNSEPKQPDYKWTDLCYDYHIYFALSYEFAEQIAEEIKKLGVMGNIVEICAGNGKLSYWLRNFGVQVIATDNYEYETLVENPMKINHRYVERLNHTQALQKYNPELVIGCWLPGTSDAPGTRYGKGLASKESDVLGWKGIRYYLNIGEGMWGMSGDWSIWERKDVEITELDNANRFALSRAYNSIDEQSFRSFAALFRKK